RRILPDYSGLDSLFIDPFGKIYPSNTWGLEIGRLERINDWERFSQRIRPALLVNQSPANWMLCTARQAMKKHWFQVVVWILREKLCLKTKGNQPQKQLSLFLKRISSIF
ncbi:MAG: hypothetical protein V1901_02835, partial [Patescibacteria group bacterium]